MKKYERVCLGMEKYVKERKSMNEKVWKSMKE